jgi:hypothetical protein
VPVRRRTREGGRGTSLGRAERACISPRRRCANRMPTSSRRCGRNLFERSSRGVKLPLPARSILCWRGTTSEFSAALRPAGGTRHTFAVLLVGPVLHGAFTRPLWLTSSRTQHCDAALAGNAAGKVAAMVLARPDYVVGGERSRSRVPVGALVRTHIRAAGDGPSNKEIAMTVYDLTRSGPSHDR